VYSRTATLLRFSPAALAAGLALVGCGGDSPQQPVATQKLAGPGFTFSAPAGREITRTPRSVNVLGEGDASTELESVTRFPLAKPFRPTLWPGASLELDGVAGRLAAGLGGEYVESPKTVRRGGLRGRSYEIAYEHDGVDLRQRLTLLLDRRTEYQLLCRWPASVIEPAACELLQKTFQLR
jgi:hypothetical protein